MCGHWFSHHELDLTGLYANAYADATYGGSDGLRASFESIMALPPERSDNRSRIAHVVSYATGRGLMRLGRKPRLLDVGAGLGVFPAGMAEFGWEVTALEEDERTVVHLREVVGIPAYAVTLDKVEALQSGVFDAVTFNKVLEHVEDPVALLALARPVLVSEGFVYFEVPDGESAAADGAGREEFFIEHHHAFSPASAALLAERAGFQPVSLSRVIEPSGKHTIRIFALRT
jgi:SAM-dependent methyltransferase